MAENNLLIVNEQDWQLLALESGTVFTGLDYSPYEQLAEGESASLVQKTLSSLAEQGHAEIRNQKVYLNPLLYEALNKCKADGSLIVLQNNFNHNSTLAWIYGDEEKQIVISKPPGATNLTIQLTEEEHSFMEVLLRLLPIPSSEEDVSFEIILSQDEYVQLMVNLQLKKYEKVVQMFENKQVDSELASEIGLILGRKEAFVSVSSYNESTLSEQIMFIPDTKFWVGMRLAEDEDSYLTLKSMSPELCLNTVQKFILDKLNSKE